MVKTLFAAILVLVITPCFAREHIRRGVITFTHCGRVDKNLGVFRHGGCKGIIRFKHGGRMEASFLFPGRGGSKGRPSLWRN